MSEQAVLGADIGGTSSKVVVASPDGRVIGFAKAGGGNVRSSGAKAYDNIFSAVEEALDKAGNPTIASAWLGIAGAGAAWYPTILEESTIRWQAAGGLSEVLSVSTDIETAFAAASPSGNGLLLLSGTGAVAATFEDFKMVSRSDGMGWLLGDEGSGTWLGIQALQAAAAAPDHRGKATVLAHLVLSLLQETFGVQGQDDPRQELIALAYQLTPAQYGMFAPLVMGHLDDPACAGIAEEAKRRLVATAKGALTAAYGEKSFPKGDLVLTGGLLEPGAPLRDPLVTDLAQELPMLSLTAQAAPPVVGALKLAYLSAGLTPNWDLLTQQVSGATPFR